MAVGNSNSSLTEVQLHNWKLLEQFQRHLAPRLACAGASAAVDHQLTASDYLSLQLFALLNPALKSARSLCTASGFKRVQQEVCRQPVKLASFSEMQHVCDPELLAGLLRDLAGQALPTFGDVGVRQKVGELIATDGTLLPALPRMAWALWQNPQNRAGKLHLEFSVWRQVPAEFTLTSANTCERLVWKSKLRKGVCYVNDRNYSHDYRLIQAVQDRGASFVLRLHNNAVMEKLSDARPLTPADRQAGVVADVRVRLGGKAQTYDTNGVVVQTFAGSGFSGYVDGVGQLTMFNYPDAMVADSHENLFVWDNANRRIRKIEPDATVTSFAGGGGLDSGIGTNVSLFGSFRGMTIDHNDTIWMSMWDGNSAYLLKITSGATITRTVLPASNPAGICADSQGNLYISSYDNKIYRYTTNGVLTVFAGSGNTGYVDGNGIFTSFYFESGPSALAVDAADNIYVWDPGNSLIRRIDQSRNVTTFAGKYLNSSIADGVGTNAAFGNIYQMCFDGSGNLILTCGFNPNGGYGLSVRKISATKNVVTMASSFSQSGYANGAGHLARFLGVSGVCVSGGTIYVADSANHRIRSITNNPTAQLVLPANLQLDTYPGLRITGTVGRTYRVESSPDMTNWTARATLLLTSSPYLWIDQNPVSGSKFYRALLLP